MPNICMDGLFANVRPNRPFKFVHINFMKMFWCFVGKFWKIYVYAYWVTHQTLQTTHKHFPLMDVSYQCYKQLYLYYRSNIITILHINQMWLVIKIAINNAHLRNIKRGTKITGEHFINTDSITFVINKKLNTLWF